MATPNITKLAAQIAAHYGTTVTRTLGKRSSDFSGFRYAWEFANGYRLLLAVDGGYGSGNAGWYKGYVTVMDMNRIDAHRVPATIAHKELVSAWGTRVRQTAWEQTRSGFSLWTEHLTRDPINYGVNA